MHPWVHHCMVHQSPTTFTSMEVFSNSGAVISRRGLHTGGATLHGKRMVILRYWSNLGQNSTCKVWSYSSTQICGPFLARWRPTPHHPMLFVLVLLKLASVDDTIRNIRLVHTFLHPEILSEWYLAWRGFRCNFVKTYHLEVFR